MKTILIIEDDQALANVYKSIFNDIKINDEFVETVLMSKGVQAGLALIELKPDLILLDLNLPDVNGDFVLKMIREKLTDVPVIVITGYCTPEMEVDLKKNGANALLRKPQSISSLVWAIGKILKRQKKLT